MDINFTDNFKANEKFSIRKASQTYEGKLTKEEGLKMLEKEKAKLRELQEKLYADGSQSILIVLQAMDAAGKDSLIEHVFGGVNRKVAKSRVSKVQVRKNIPTIFCADNTSHFPKKEKSESSIAVITKVF